MRFIDADALYNGTMKQEYFDYIERDNHGRESFVYSCAMQRLAEAPTVDAIPVVRCKKCVHWLRDTLRQNSNDVAWWNEAVCDRHSYDGLEIIKKWTSADFYCADGERRDDGCDWPM